MDIAVWQGKNEIRGTLKLLGCKISLKRNLLEVVNEGPVISEKNTETSQM